MAEGGEVYDSADEYNRAERIETIYQGWGARDMAERIVELEDELGADIDGICTGMHADVAEARGEITRLRDLLHYEHNRANSAINREDTADRAAEEAREEAERLRSAWKSARRRASRAMGAWRYMRWREDAQSEEMRAQDEYARWLWDQMSERRKERDRYRLAWLSARRRAADEANFGMEALDRERARQASFVAELQPTLRRRMEELRRLRAFAADVIAVRGWCMDGTHADVRRFLDEIYGSTFELEAADREGRPFRARLERRAIRGDFDEVYEADEAP